jgi:hypothetical protein
MPFPVTGYPVAEYLFTYPVLPAELLLRESALLPAFHQGKHLGLGSDLCHRFFRRIYNATCMLIKATLPDGY